MPKPFGPVLALLLCGGMEAQNTLPLTSVKTSPNVIQANRATAVTVDVNVATARAAARPPLRLIRTLPDGKMQDLGAFRDLGSRYTIQVSFNETAQGRITLRAALAPRQEAAVAMVRSLFSAPFFISVQGAAPPAQSSSIEITNVTPDRIPANTATRIQISAKAANVPARLLQVLRRTPSGNQQIGTVNDAGINGDAQARDGIYSGALNFNEVAGSTVTLVVADVRREVFSPAFLLQVQSAAVPDASVQRARGFMARIPEGFTWNTKVAAAGGPWSANNFGGRYLRGGVIPAGGCEIEGTPARAPSGVETLIRQELPGASQPERSQVNGRTVFRLVDDDEIVPGVPYRMIAAYIASGQAAYKLFATYRAGDKVEPLCRRALDQVVTSFSTEGR